MVPVLIRIKINYCDGGAAEEKIGETEKSHKPEAKYQKKLMLCLKPMRELRHKGVHSSDHPHQFYRGPPLREQRVNYNQCVFV